LCEEKFFLRERGKMEDERTRGKKETAEKFIGRCMYLLPLIIYERWNQWKRGCLRPNYRREKRERHSDRSKRGGISYRGKCQARKTLRLDARCLQCVICSSSSLDDSNFSSFYSSHAPRPFLIQIKSGLRRGFWPVRLGC
jgi:hypothetical protein